MKTLFVLIIFFISCGSLMSNSFQNKTIPNSSSKQPSSRVLKITVSKDSIKANVVSFQVEGIIKNTSKTDTIRYESWAIIKYINKRTGQWEEVNQTSALYQNIYWEVPPLGRSFYNVGHSSIDRSQIYSGTGTISIFVTKQGNYGIENRISNLIKVKVNFENNTATILQNIP